MNRIGFFLFLVILFSCEVKSQEIFYGQDTCHFCKMTIVDRQHSAQLVTKKGKAFKYDAIECMVTNLTHWEYPEVKYFLVANYSHPGNLTDAREAHFLITQTIPSPMGEFLTAFKNKEDRDKVLLELGGEPLDWETLQEKFEAR